MRSRLFSAALLLALCVCSASRAQEAGNEADATEEERETREEEEKPARKLHIKVSPVRAEISPTVEVSLPSGNLSEHFEYGLNRLDMAFSLDYNFLDDSLFAGVIFSSRFKRFTPSVGFSEKLDFENLVTPKIVGSKVTLAPTEKYISRVKSVDVDLAYNFARNLFLVQTFVFSDVFRGSLSSGTMLDDGIDLTERIGLVLNSVEAGEPARGVTFRGTYAGTLLEFRFRDGFGNPIEITSRNTVLSHANLGHGWNLQVRVSANSPVKVFDEEKAAFYTLGGFDTIRGYPHGSLNAFRFVHLGSTWEREILRDREIRFRLFRLRAVARQFSPFFLLDGLVLQDRLDIGSPAVFHSSAGAGFSLVITGKRGGHLRVSLCLAQPLERGYSPVFTFRSSIFNFEGKR